MEAWAHLFSTTKRLPRFRKMFSAPELRFSPDSRLIEKTNCSSRSSLLWNSPLSAVWSHRAGSACLSPCQTVAPLGWVTDRTGYRYSGIDPETNRAWPEMPPAFRKLAESAANEAGFPNFVPDACLINRYEPGTKLSLHQDKDERDFSQPIVSVSLGLPATFLFGGLERGGKVVRIPLVHGDVVVWGGPARLRYHGVAPLREGEHPRLGRIRYNLTFRKAG